MGYRISLLRAGERHPPYSYADISQVVALTDGRHTVDVMVSNTDAAVEPPLDERRRHTDIPYRRHSITNKFSMFVDAEKVQSVATSYREMLDVEWCLDGTLDPASGVFVFPRVNEIEDPS